MNVRSNYEIIGAASGWGSPQHGTEKGPLILRELLMGVGNKSKVDGAKVLGLTQGHSLPSWAWPFMVHAEKSLSQGELGVGDTSVWLVEQVCQDLAGVVSHVVRRGHFPLVVGGDHSIAVGTWSGIITSLKAEQQFGLLWIDAHMDSHTPKTTPSHAYHGMPLAALLGHGRHSLTHLGTEKAKLNPEHVALLGVRSFESGEKALLEKLGVRIFYRDEVRARGFDICLQEAVERVSHQTIGFGVSFDLDVFDPSVAPGVGTPEKDGLLMEEVMPFLPHFAAHERFYGFECVEYNPFLDTHNKTSHVAAELLLSVMTHHQKAFKSQKKGWLYNTISQAV